MYSISSIPIVLNINNATNHTTLFFLLALHSANPFHAKDQAITKTINHCGNVARDADNACKSIIDDNFSFFINLFSFSKTFL